MFGLGFLSSPWINLDSPLIVVDQISDKVSLIRPLGFAFYIYVISTSRFSNDFKIEVLIPAQDDLIILLISLFWPNSSLPNSYLRLSISSSVTFSPTPIFFIFDGCDPTIVLPKYSSINKIRWPILVYGIIMAVFSRVKAPARTI